MTLFPPVLETERLRLERLGPDTMALREYYEYSAAGHGTVDEEFTHLGGSPFETLNEAHDYLQRAAQQWDDGEAAHYAVFPREGEDGAGEYAGNATLTPEWERRSAITGLRLRKPFWGRGYSGERAGALLAVAFERLDLDLVSPGHFTGNDQSKRAIEKYVERFGGQYDGILRNWVPVDDEVRDLHRYTITREQWREAVGEDHGVTVHTEAES